MNYSIKPMSKEYWEFYVPVKGAFLALKNLFKHLSNLKILNSIVENVELSFSSKICKKKHP